MSNGKEIIYKSISFFIIVIALLSIYCLFWGPLNKWGSSFVPSKKITISSEGDIDVSPDMATITFSSIKEGKDTKAILNDVNNNISKAVNMIKKLGVNEKDIKTMQYKLIPVYTQKYDSGASDFIPKIAKYKAIQSVSVNIYNFSLISKILENFQEYNINEINGIKFDIKDKDNFLAKAREKAFNSIKEKAKQIMADTGIKIGNIINISENNYIPSFYREGITYSQPFQENSPTINPGLKKLKVNMSVTYEIK